MNIGTKIGFVLGALAMLGLGAGQLTGGGGLTKVVHTGGILAGSGTTAAPLSATITTGTGITGTGSAGSPLAATATGTVTTSSPIQGTGSAGSPVTLTSADYGDVTVTGGMTWTVDALPESRITNLTSDLAARALTSSLAAIATSGSATDLTSGSVPAARLPALTGDVTSSAGSVATTIAADAVGNSKLANMANATFKLRTTAGTGDPEDGTVAQAVALLTSVTGFHFPDLGDGNDGAPVFDCTNTFTWATKSGTGPCTYTLSRNVFWAGATINSGTTIKPDGWVIRSNSNIINNGDVNTNGLAAVTQTGGNVTWTTGRELPRGEGGGNGGQVGGASNPAPHIFSTAAVAGGIAGTAPAGTGGAGNVGGLGHGSSGGGSGGGAVSGSGNVGAAGGTVTLGTGNGSILEYYIAITGRIRNTTTQWVCASGGGGGANGTVGGNGGGAGGGGGWMVVIAYSISGSGTWRSVGGTGADGVVPATASGGGGGAGGTGGIVAIRVCVGAYPTADISGGAGGAGGAGTAGAGAGGPGGTGGVGYYIKL